MAQLNHRKLLLFYVLLFLSLSVCFGASSLEPQHSRRMLGAQKQEQEKPLKNKTTAKNQTKPIKPTNSISSTNHTKTTKSPHNISSKNQTKPLKPSSTNSASTDTALAKKLNSKIKKLNVTSKTSKTTIIQFQRTINYAVTKYSQKESMNQRKQYKAMP